MCPASTHLSLYTFSHYLTMFCRFTLKLISLCYQVCMFISWTLYMFLIECRCYLRVQINLNNFSLIISLSFNMDSDTQLKWIRHLRRNRYINKFININSTLKIVPKIMRVSYFVWIMQIVKYPLLCVTESHTAQSVRQSVWKDWIGEASMDKTMMSFQICWKVICNG